MDMIGVMKMRPQIPEDWPVSLQEFLEHCFEVSNGGCVSIRARVCVCRRYIADLFLCLCVRWVSKRVAD